MTYDLVCKAQQAVFRGDRLQAMNLLAELEATMRPGTAEKPQNGTDLKDRPDLGL